MLLLWDTVDLGVMAMKGYSAFSKATEASRSDCLVSYTGHSLGESYSSAEMQSVYSTAPSERWKLSVNHDSNVFSFGLSLAS